MGFSAQCPNMLYDLNCKALRSANLFSGGTIATVSGNQVTVPGLDAAKGVGWAALGEVVILSTGDRRLVKTHAATDTLTLLYPFDPSPLGETVEVAAGCKHDPTDCDTKFGNLPNYSGFPHIPQKNPFQSGII
mgnify:CR=1 FL=1